MTSDSDIVLQDFGEASETHFLLFEVLQLFLSLECEQTSAPYDIDARDVHALCLEPHPLPINIRDFILWQCNAKKRDNGEILKIKIPYGLSKRYDVRQAKLATYDAKQRVAAIKDSIAEIDAYLKELHEVCAILEAADDRLDNVIEKLSEAYKLDEGLAEHLEPHDKRIQEELAAIDELHAALEGDVMPDMVTYDDGSGKIQATFDCSKAKMHRLIRRLSDHNLHITDIMRRYRLNYGDESGEAA